MLVERYYVKLKIKAVFYLWPYVNWQIELLNSSSRSLLISK